MADDKKEELTEDEKMRVEIITSAVKRIKARRTFNDGYTSLKQPGESMMPGWHVGSLVATLKELSEIFDMKPWMNGSKASGCAKGKFLFQYGMKDTNSTEWIFSLEHPFETIDANENTMFSWRVDGVSSVSDIGNVLANRLRRSTEMVDVDSGRILHFQYVAPEASETNAEGV